MNVSPTINSLHGRIISITGDDPAPGSEILITVPARRRWKILNLRFPLVSDVTETDRTVYIQVSDDTNTILILPQDQTQAASLTYNYHYLPWSLAAFKIPSQVLCPIPSLTLAAGFTITTVTANIQAGDNFGAPLILVEEWIDP